MKETPWLEEFEDTLLPIQHCLRNRFEESGNWPKLAETARYFQIHEEFPPDATMPLAVLVLMFLNHPVELDAQLELLD